MLTEAAAAETGVGPGGRLGLVAFQNLLHQLLHGEVGCAAPVAARPLDPVNCGREEGGSVSSPGSPALSSIPPGRRRGRCPCHGHWGTGWAKGRLFSIGPRWPNFLPPDRRQLPGGQSTQPAQQGLGVQRLVSQSLLGTEEEEEEEAAGLALLSSPCWWPEQAQHSHRPLAGGPAGRSELLASGGEDRESSSYNRNGACNL